MSNRIGLFIALGYCIVASTSGCSPTRHLHNTTVAQANTVSRIHQEQVLDNVAMFVHDPNAWPFFSIPEGGSTGVADENDASLGIDWVRSGFDMVGLDLSKSRDTENGWTLIPVNDPHKLLRMRCAYQHAVEGCSCSPQICDCLDCDEVRHDFEGGHSGEKLNGLHPDHCLSSCWFRYGPKECVPKSCDVVGEYCGTYVWVTNSAGRNELSKLTMQILEYAYYEPVVLTEQVVEYYGEDGETRTTSANAKIVVTRQQPSERRDGVDQGTINLPSQNSLSPYSIDRFRLDNIQRFSR